MKIYPTKGIKLKKKTLQIISKVAQNHARKKWVVFWYFLILSYRWFRKKYANFSLLCVELKRPFSLRLTVTKEAPRESLLLKTRPFLKSPGNSSKIIITWSILRTTNWTLKPPVCLKLLSSEDKARFWFYGVPFCHHLRWTFIESPQANICRIFKIKEDSGWMLDAPTFFVVSTVIHNMNLTWHFLSWRVDIY